MRCRPGGEAESDELGPLSDRQRLDRDDRLAEDPAVVAVVPTEREDRVGRPLVGECDAGVRGEQIDRAVDRDLAVHAHPEVESVHVLGIDLHGRREDVQVVPEGLEQMVGIAGVVGAEALIVVLPDHRAGDERAVLGDVVGAAKTEESTAGEVVGAVLVHRQGLDEHRDVVGVAGHHVDEAVLLADEGLVVDAPCIHLAEPELRALGQESERPRRTVVVLLLVGVSSRRAVDHHAGSFDGLLGGVDRRVAHGLERVPAIVVDAEDGASLNEIPNLGALVDEGGPLVEGDLIDPEGRGVVGQEPDERLPDGPGPDDVDDLAQCHSL